MCKRLQEIAEIASGNPFRGSIENNPKGDISVLQAKNVVNNQDVFDSTDFIKISETPIRTPYFLEYNDIILVSKGSGLGSFRSSVFNSFDKKIMPSSTVLIIKIKDITVLSKYVSLYLNSDTGQKSLLQITTGGSLIKSILIRNLRDLKIPIPSVDKQKSIVALHENMRAQEKILKRKNELKQNIISSTFTNLVKI